MSGGNGANGNGGSGNGRGGEDFLSCAFDRTSYVGGQPVPDPNPFAFNSTTPEPFCTEVLEVAPVPQAAMQLQARIHQVPMEMVVTSFLGGAGGICQHIADVDRGLGDGLVAPISLYSLVIAESGERKTTVDKALVSGPIDEGMKILTQTRRRDLLARDSAYKAWVRKKADTERRLTRLRTSTKTQDEAAIEEAEEELKTLEANEPAPARWPKLLFEDVTVEAVKHAISEYPVGLLNTSEGGSVVGGRVMTDENCLAFCSFGCAAWEGQTLRVERRTSAGFLAEGRRFSMSVAMQPPVFERFLRAGDGAVRAGLLARFLIAAPVSMGHLRRITEINYDETPMQALRAMIVDILLRPLPTVRPDLAIVPPRIGLADGRKTWIDYHDWCMAEMGPGRPLTEIRDMARRSPEQAARIAAILHIFRHGPQPALTAPMAIETVEAAIAIARWYLFEARRILVDDRAIAEDAKKVLRVILDRGGMASRLEIANFVSSRVLRADVRQRQRAIAWLLQQGLVLSVKAPKTVLLAHPQAAVLLAQSDNL